MSAPRRRRTARRGRSPGGDAGPPLPPAELLRAHPELVDESVSALAALHALSDKDADELRFHVHESFMRDDFTLLREFGGPASLVAEVHVAIVRLAEEHLGRQWLRWRSDAVTCGLGEIAIAIERLVYDEALGFAEALEIVSGDRDLPRLAAIQALWARRPWGGVRPVTDLKWLVSSDETPPALLGVASDPGRPRQLTDLERHLRDALRHLAADDRLLLHLHFVGRLPVGVIALSRRRTVRSVSRRIQRLLSQLRVHLRRLGVEVESAEVGPLLADPRPGYRTARHTAALTNRPLHGARESAGARPSKQAEVTHSLMSPDRTTWWRRLAGRASAALRKAFGRRSVKPPQRPWPPAAPCPDLRTFAAFAEDELPPEQVERLVSHVAECPTCIGWVKKLAVMLLRIVASIDRSFELPRMLSLRRANGRALLSAGLAAGLTAAAAIAVVLVQGWKPSAADPRAVLASTVAGERPYVPRFTGSVPWSPPAPRGLRRGPGEADLRPGAVSYLAAAEIGRMAIANPDARELGTIGALQALGGRLAPGVETLRRALAAETESPTLLNDLAAALLAREEVQGTSDVDGDPTPYREDRDSDVVEALELIERALAKSPDLPEALFNRALALERLYLPISARKAWERFLSVDSRSPWAAEARERQAAIEIAPAPEPERLRAEIAAAASSGDPARLAALVSSQRHLARRVTQEDLLPAWGEAVLRGDAGDARARLSAARAVAVEWEAQTSDRSLLSAVAEVERAGGPTRERLARGYQALGASARAHDAFDLSAADAAAMRALATLPERSVAARWALVLRLAAAMYGPQPFEPLARALRDDADADPATRGRALWLTGLWRVKRGDFAAALADYLEAVALYERLDEREPVVWLRQLIGEDYGLMGASATSWRYLRAAMKDAPALANDWMPFAVFLDSAAVALSERRPRAAAAILDEALALPGVQSPLELTEGYLWRSHIRRILGDRAGATNDFARASMWFRKCTAAGTRYLGPRLSFGRALLAEKPVDAIAGFSAAMDGYKATGEVVRLPDVLLERAQAQLRAGRPQAADADLRRALVLLEQQQGSEGAPLEIWASLRGGPDAIFDARVSLAFSHGRFDEAFAVAESAKAQVLRKAADHDELLAGRRSVAALQLSDLRSRLERDVTMLYFVTLPDRVLMWRVQHQRSSLITLATTPSEISRWAAAFKADLEAEVWAGATRDLAMRLYAALLGPAELGRGPLLVVPDGALHSVPFAALIDPATGRFVVQDRAVTVAPSAAAYLRARDRSRALGAAPPDDALVLGDPDLSAVMHRGMLPLAGARDEARAVAALYPRRQLLLGTAATRSAFVSSAGDHQIVHFAGHALASPIHPQTSSLPLASEARGGGDFLLATDIADLDLARTRTVVLSGCDTGTGLPAGGEGPLSFARAFLIAGVPSVVASLWQVPDGPSAPLMTAFHRRLRQGEPAADALRSAQLEMLHGNQTSQQSPPVWASFQAFGG